MQACKDSLATLEQQEAELIETEARLRTEIDQTGTDLGDAAQVQDKYMVQKRQLDEKLTGPKAVTDEQERAKLAGLVADLQARETEVEDKIHALMEQDDQLRARLQACEQDQVAAREQVEALKAEMLRLEETLKADPGLPVIKVNGTIYARTTVAGLHKKLKLTQDMVAVRIAESKTEPGGNAWQIKISNLR